jgi:hypothetical protein
MKPLPRREIGPNPAIEKSFMNVLRVVERIGDLIARSIRPPT